MKNKKRIDQLSYSDMSAFLEGPCALAADRLLAEDGYLRINPTDSGVFGNVLSEIMEVIAPGVENNSAALTDRYFPDRKTDRFVGDPRKYAMEADNLAMARYCAVMEAAYLLGIAVGRRIGAAPLRAAARHPVKRSAKRGRAA